MRVGRAETWLSFDMPSCDMLQYNAVKSSHLCTRQACHSIIHQQEESLNGLWHRVMYLTSFMHIAADCGVISGASKVVLTCLTPDLPCTAMEAKSKSKGKPASKL